MDNNKDINIIKKPVFTEENTFNTYQFISMMLSVQTMFFRSKPMLWCGLLFLLSSYFVRKKNQDKSQFFMIIIMICFSFYSLYFNDISQTINKNFNNNVPKEAVINDQDVEGVIIDN